MEAEAVHFVYEAPASCPGEADFLETVARDGGHLTRAPDDAPARTLVLTIELAEPAVGRLVIRDLLGHEAVRPLTGEHCADVVRSLAVLVALSLGPQPPPAAPPTGTSLRTRESSGARDKPRKPLPWGHWRFGASTETTATLDGVISQAFFAETQYEGLAAVAPLFRAGVVAPSSWVDSGTASLSRRLARFEACPVRALGGQSTWSPRTYVAAQLCAQLDAGTLEVQGHAEQVGAWVAPGAMVQIRFLWSVAFLDLQGGAQAPLLRDRFDSAPGVLGYQAPRVLGALGIGCGVYFL